MNQRKIICLIQVSDWDPIDWTPIVSSLFKQLELVEENTQRVQGPFPPLTA